MWIVCITSVRHVLTVNGYGGRQTKENEKSWCFKGWETLDTNLIPNSRINFVYIVTRLIHHGVISTDVTLQDEEIVALRFTPHCATTALNYSLICTLLRHNPYLFQQRKRNQSYCMPKKMCLFPFHGFTGRCPKV